MRKDYNPLTTSVTELSPSALLGTEDFFVSPWINTSFSTVSTDMNDWPLQPHHNDSLSLLFGGQGEVAHGACLNHPADTVTESTTSCLGFNQQEIRSVLYHDHLSLIV